jgi:hypothetical protein
MDWEDYWRKGKENLEIADLALQNKRYNVCAVELTMLSS